MSCAVCTWVLTRCEARWLHMQTATFTHSGSLSNKHKCSFSTSAWLVLHTVSWQKWPVENHCSVQQRASGTACLRRIKLALAEPQTFSHSFLSYTHYQAGKKLISSPVVSLTTFELQLEGNPLEAFIFSAMACSLRNLDLGGLDSPGFLWVILLWIRR